VGEAERELADDVQRLRVVDRLEMVEDHGDRLGRRERGGQPDSTASGATNPARLRAAAASPSSTAGSLSLLSTDNHATGRACCADHWVRTVVFP
jgi:hypothetical protein